MTDIECETFKDSFILMQSNGIRGATKLLKWFNILPDIQIDDLLYSEALDPRIGSGNVDHHMPWADNIEIQFGYKFNNRAYLLQVNLNLLKALVHICNL